MAGPKPKMTDAQWNQAFSEFESGVPVDAIVGKYGITKTYFVNRKHRWKKEMKAARPAEQATNKASRRVKTSKVVGTKNASPSIELQFWRSVAIGFFMNQISANQKEIDQFKIS